MNAVISLGGTVALLLLAGTALGLLDRERFAIRWLLVATLLVIVNDALLTRLYGVVPAVFGGERNWLGKLLALAATLTIAAHPRFTWREVGLTLQQRPGALRSALPVALSYGAFFVMIAVMLPNDTPTREEIAFQLTMPGFEEEPFYRGVLLVALSQAYTGRWRALGVEWNWGALLSCLLFGMAHAFGFSNGHFSFDPLTMALTAVPAFLGVWMWLRTGSLLLPVIMHNFGNAITLLL